MSWVALALEDRLDERDGWAVVGSLRRVEANSTPTVCSDGFLTVRREQHRYLMSLLPRATQRTRRRTGAIEEGVQEARLARARLA